MFGGEISEEHALKYTIETKDARVRQQDKRPYVETNGRCERTPARRRETARDGSYVAAHAYRRGWFAGTRERALCGPRTEKRLRVRKTIADAR